MWPTANYMCVILLSHSVWWPFTGSNQFLGGSCLPFYIVLSSFVWFCPVLSSLSCSTVIELVASYLLPFCPVWIIQLVANSRTSSKKKYVGVMLRSTSEWRRWATGACRRPSWKYKSNNWLGYRVWGEWASSRVASERDGVVAVTTPLLEMPPADLAYWMGKFVLEVRKKDGQEYLPKSIYALVCCFKRYYEQHGVFDVNPLSSSDSRFGNFRVTLDTEMKREKENDPDSDSVICLALYIPHQIFSLENLIVVAAFVLVRLICWVMICILFILQLLQHWVMLLCVLAVGKVCIYVVIAHLSSLTLYLKLHHMTAFEEYDWLYRSRDQQ